MTSALLLDDDEGVCPFCHFVMVLEDGKLPVHYRYRSVEPGAISPDGRRNDLCDGPGRFLHEW